MNLAEYLSWVIPSTTSSSTWVFHSYSTLVESKLETLVAISTAILYFWWLNHFGLSFISFLNRYFSLAYSGPREFGELLAQVLPSHEFICHDRTVVVNSRDVECGRHLACLIRLVVSLLIGENEGRISAAAATLLLLLSEALRPFLVWLLLVWVTTIDMTPMLLSSLWGFKIWRIVLFLEACLADSQISLTLESDWVCSLVASLLLGFQFHILRRSDMGVGELFPRLKSLKL